MNFFRKKHFKDILINKNTITQALMTCIRDTLNGFDTLMITEATGFS